jgi:GDPmannose 4,6-dehydratase
VGLHWRDHVVIDPMLTRPADVQTLCADSSKAQSTLGWKPSVEFGELIRMMVESDLAQEAMGQERGELLLTSTW